MDDETQDAMEMSPEELAARWAKGEKAKVRKRDDFVQRMRGVVDETIARSEDDVSGFAATFDAATITVDGCSFVLTDA